MCGFAHPNTRSEREKRKPLERGPPGDREGDRVVVHRELERGNGGGEGALGRERVGRIPGQTWWPPLDLFQNCAAGRRVQRSKYLGEGVWV